MKHGARALIHRTMSTQEKGKEPKTVREINMTIKVPNADELIGDGNANVGRSRTLKMGLPYGVAAISATCTVSLTCNQDIKTIGRTGKLCTRIIDKMMVEDQEDMAEFIKAMKEEYDE